MTYRVDDSRHRPTPSTDLASASPADRPKTRALRVIVAPSLAALIAFAPACSSSSSSPPNDLADTGSSDAAGATDGSTSTADSGGTPPDGACDSCSSPPTCPAWTTFSFPEGMAGTVGEALTLMVGASGDDPSQLTYTWTTSNPIGTFGANDASSGSDTTTFTCNAPGDTTLTLTIGPVPGDGAACAVPTNVLTAMFTCAASSTLDAGTADSALSDAASIVDAGARD
jgi:hypothetical protein